MRIVMLTSRVPWPLEKGDKLRAYHQLRIFSAHHEVHLLCLNDSAIHPDALIHLKTITPYVHIFPIVRWKILFRLIYALAGSKPFQVHYFFQNRTARLVRNKIEEIKPDHIYCQLVRTSEYVKHMHHYKKTLDYMDALSAGYTRRLQRVKWWQRLPVAEEVKRLRAYENLVYDYFDHHTIISEQDRQLIMHPMRDRIAVVPNGVDTEYFKPLKTQKKYDLLFTGNMSYPPNVECAKTLATEILPLVRRTLPDTNLLIAGTTPTSEVRALADQKIIVSGWMEDIRDAYSSAKVFVAPMRSGSGLQNKLLEAMSCGLPCVTTQLAANPIGASHKLDIMIGESNEEIAQHIIALLQQPALVHTIGENGRNKVKQHFNWQNATQQLLKLWKS